MSASAKVNHIDGGTHETRMKRPAGFYLTDNEIIDCFAKEIGIYALGVYHLLLCEAGKNGGRARVGLRRISSTLAISKDAASAALETLKRDGLISEELSKDPNLSSAYIVEWGKDVDQARKSSDGCCPEFRPPNIEEDRIQRKGQNTLLILPAGGPVLEHALSGISRLQPQEGDVSDLRSQITQHMRSAGYAVIPKFKVGDRGDGRAGFLELLCTHGAETVAFEFGARIPKEKSLTKLRRVDGHRAIVLRTASQQQSFPGIDTCIAMNWPSNRIEVPRQDHKSELEARRHRNAMVGLPAAFPESGTPALLSSQVRIGVRDALAEVRKQLVAFFEQLTERERDAVGDSIDAWDRKTAGLEYHSHGRRDAETGIIEVVLVSPVAELSQAALQEWEWRFTECLKEQLGVPVCFVVTPRQVKEASSPLGLPRSSQMLRNVS